MNDEIIIVGCGGHARVVSGIILAERKFRICGLLDKTKESLGEKISGAKIIGSFDDLAEYIARGFRLFALALGDNRERAEVYRTVFDLGGQVPAIIHPLALVEKDCVIGNGSQICLGAIVCAKATVGENTIVNTGAIIDHESIIGNSCHIAPGTVVAGRVKVGDGTFIGVGCSIKDNISIGSNCIIGAGSVVVDDIPGNVLAYGSPARIKTR